ncbi:unnamed protein product [Cuscuta campestris]|uniref:Miro domain-containing protein n=1 Tax=Cuscuta campestris TaxID=132261 RepID=A0A484NCQ0_9ASTE|nr:unnamed protein product [Cuscuta campestris]
MNQMLMTDTQLMQSVCLGWKMGRGKKCGGRKTLVLHEVPNDAVQKLLSGKDALAACDVAIFVHDSSSEPSWRRASELLVDVASNGEATGYEIPCLIVAAKDDLDPYLTEIQDSTRLLLSPSTTPLSVILKTSLGNPGAGAFGSGSDRIL